MTSRDKLMLDPHPPGGPDVLKIEGGQELSRSCLQGGMHCLRDNSCLANNLYISLDAEWTGEESLWRFVSTLQVRGAIPSIPHVTKLARSQGCKASNPEIVSSIGVCLEFPSIVI
jgi:hypothetical protein